MQFYYAFSLVAVLENTFSLYIYALETGGNSIICSVCERDRVKVREGEKDRGRERERERGRETLLSKLLVYDALSYKCMRPEAPSV